MNHVDCPKCTGSGKVVLTVHELGKETSMVVTCLDCHGAGKLTPEQAQIIEEQKNLWCECDDVQPDQILYVDDGEGVIEKHHWICTNCNKIFQIG